MAQLPLAYALLHITIISLFQVVLVGRYNAQGLLGSDSSEIEQSIKRLVVSTGQPHHVASSSRLINVFLISDVQLMWRARL